MSTKTITCVFEGVPAPVPYLGLNVPPLALRARTSFAGVAVREYHHYDLSTEFRTILLNCFDLYFWINGGKDAPTVEIAKKWLYEKTYAEELLRWELSGFSGQMARAKDHAEWTVRCTQWEIHYNNNGETIIRGWFREDLS